MLPLYVSILGLAFLSPARAQSADKPSPDSSVETRLDFYQQKISTDMNPNSAEGFLDDQPVLSYLKSKDFDQFSKLSARAAYLKRLKHAISYIIFQEDLYELLVDDDSDPQAPKGLGFGSKPQRLYEWSKKYLSLYEMQSKKLRTALWEFDTLSEKRAKWLQEKNGITQEQWKDVSFRRRQKLMDAYYKAAYEFLTNFVPRNEQDAEWLLRVYNDVEHELFHNLQDGALEPKIKKAQHIISLGHLGKDPRVLNDPSLKELLEKAKTGSLEDMGSSIAKIYDRLDAMKRPGLSPPPAGPIGEGIAKQASETVEKLSDEKKDLLTSMLATALPKEVGAVDAGKSVAEFYQKTPPKILIEDLPGSLGEFKRNPDRIVLDETLIMSWLKAENRKPTDVFQKPVFDELIMLLGPLFAHEGTHQLQALWKDKNSVYFNDSASQEDEVEAFSVSSLYTLQRAQADKRFREFLSKNQEKSASVHQFALLAEKFRTDPNGLRDRVAADYPGIPRLEDYKTNRIKEAQAHAQQLQEELNRRLKLPRSDQRYLEENGKVEGELPRDMRELKTSVIDYLLKSAIEERDYQPDAYLRSRERYAKIMENLEESRRKVKDIIVLNQNDKDKGVPGVQRKALAVPPPPPIGLPIGEGDKDKDK